MRTDFFLRINDLRVSASHTIESLKSSSLEILASFFFFGLAAAPDDVDVDVDVAVVKLRILLSQSWQ